KRGLRQKDPISPYLFTLVMEVLTLMLHQRAHSARVIMDTLEEFKEASWLSPSVLKSMPYFCNVLNYVKLDILNILSFEEGKLPVKYLGVPLVPSCLIYRDCKELMEKVKRHINDWKNKSVSLVGRDQLIRGFIWCQGEFKKGKAKVAWDVVCLPKREGSLGIRRLEVFNKDLITSHIWNLLSHKESLWVKWIHTYKLNERSFSELPIRGNMSWGWHKILHVRQVVRPYFCFCIRDVTKASAWFDNWCSVSPLANNISNRNIYGDGFNRSTKLRDIIVNNVWSWPNFWLLKYTVLTTIGVLHFSNASDCLVWKNSNNVELGFSVAIVWNSIRLRFNEVDWYYVVWFSRQIPHHAIHLWLITKRKLNTQDVLRPWDVWDHMKSFMAFSKISFNLDDIMGFISLMAKMRSARSVITKLVFAASCYFIWQERNYSSSRTRRDPKIRILRRVSFKDGKGNVFAKEMEGLEFGGDESEGGDPREDGFDGDLVSNVYSDCQSVDSRSYEDLMSERDVHVDLEKENELGPMSVPVEENLILSSRIIHEDSPRILRRGEVLVDGRNSTSVDYSVNKAKIWPKVGSVSKNGSNGRNSTSADYST
nr:hypothetical protein [Tanacetum cinerariifolium]